MAEPGSRAAERRVFRMPDDLANQIAAGEVVERPASALKELVENALDAGARRIRIELADGGLQLIRVADDGCGMSREDAETAMQRHATSKLRTSDDLFRISTLGFRGEALPSIASVSRFELVTKPHGRIGGTRVRVIGGGEPEVSDMGCPPGTEITVRDLFFNTPARLKFLKTKGTEVKQCVEAVQRIALVRHDVGFTVSVGGREVLDWPAVATPADRVHAYFGRPDADGVFTAVVAEVGSTRVSGFVGQPSLSRRTAVDMLTYVNGRYVRDKLLASAIRVGFGHLVDRGRHPVAVMFVELPVDAIDVNVHPAKTEVRFHQQDEVFRAVRRSVASTLAACPWVPAPSQAGPPAGRDARPGDTAEPGALSFDMGNLDLSPFRLPAPSGLDAGRLYRPAAHDERPGSRLAWGAPGPADDARAAPARPYRLGPPPDSVPFDSPAPGVAAASQGSAAGSAGASPRAGGYGVPGVTAPSGASAAHSAAEAPARAVPRPGDPGTAPARGFFSRLHYLATFRATYLLAADGDGLVVVDQHAAHERITFEALRLAWRGRELAIQPLLLPQVLTFDPVRAAVLDESLGILERLGFELEPFGGNDFALKAVPAIFAGARHERLIRDAVDELAETGQTSRVDDAWNAVLSRMACHASVRAGDGLGPDEVRQLFADLDAVDFGANCPHGRPVWFRMNLAEIESRFDRR